MDRSLHIAVFGSGRGSNFQSILTAIRRGEIQQATVRVVISNNSTAGILQIARTNGIPAEHVSAAKCASEAAFTDALLAILRKYDVNFIVLAGYMKRIPPGVVEKFRSRIVNIHPALLPKFGGEGMYGMRVHEAVIAAKEKHSGATVHLVDEEYDRGAIVLQKKIDVRADDSATVLAERVLQLEHELYPEALKMIAEGRVLQIEATETKL